MKDNIILFPFKETHKIPTPSTLEEVQENAYNIKVEQIDFITAEVFCTLLENITAMGINVSLDAIKDHAFVHETISALLYKYHGMYHPLHKIIDKTLIEEDGTYYIKTRKPRKKKEAKQEINL